MKKLFLSFLIIGILFGVNSCSKKNNTEENTTGVMLPNPFVDCETLEEAEKISGVDITLPGQLPEWVNTEVYRAMKNNFLEIIYYGNLVEKEIRIRKVLTEENDISGDYNHYENETKAVINGKNITLKMNDDKVFLAIWKTGDYAYSVKVNGGTGKEEILSLIRDIE